MRLEALGMQVAGQAASGILGMALGGQQDRRQYKQAEKMQRLQVRGSKELTDYNAAKQLQMWKDTGYGPQKQQMKEAGLNPALMYGMGGGGGQSSSVNTGSVSSGGSPTTGGEVQAMMGMGLQQGLLQAQIANINADTKLKEKTVPKTEAETAKIILEGANIKMQTRLNEAVARINETGAQVAEDTMWEAEAQIVNNSRIAREVLDQWVRENGQRRAAYDQKITALQQEGLQAIAQVALTKAQKSGIMQNIEQSKAQIGKWLADIEQKWAEIAQGGRAISNQEKQTFIQDSLKDIDRTFKEALIEQGQWHNFTNGVGQILQMGTKIPVGTKPGPVTGFGGNR